MTYDIYMSSTPARHSTPEDAYHHTIGQLWKYRRLLLSWTKDSVISTRDNFCHSPHRVLSNMHILIRICSPFFIRPCVCLISFPLLLLSYYCFDTPIEKISISQFGNVQFVPAVWLHSSKICISMFCSILRCRPI